MSTEKPELHVQIQKLKLAKVTETPWTHIILNIENKCPVLMTTVFSGTQEKTFGLIRFRAANDASFIKTKFATKSLWE